MTGARHSGRVLVTGATGMLGSELLLSAPAGIEALGSGRGEARAGAPAVAFAGIDLAEPGAVERLFERAGALVGVVNCAAHTAVDKAEQEEALALRQNADVPEALARACAARGLPFVHVSTDFVFDGSGSRPYRPDDPVAPLGAYGRTKLEGERRVRAACPGAAIVRTQWLYGPRGKHFPGTILALAATKPELKVVHDQVGAPTSTLELAPALWDVLLKRASGIFHAACEGRASWFEFARATLELAGSRTPIHPCTTAEFPRPAQRPAYSVLDCTTLTALRGRPLKPWREALADFLAHERLLVTSAPSSK
jgi:dTDP-4-dehydrorhamnose reductase